MTIKFIIILKIVKFIITIITIVLKVLLVINYFIELNVNNFILGQKTALLKALSHFNNKIIQNYFNKKFNFIFNNY